MVVRKRYPMKGNAKVVDDHEVNPAVVPHDLTELCVSHKSRRLVARVMWASIEYEFNHDKIIGNLWGYKDKYLPNQKWIII